LSLSLNTLVSLESVVGIQTGLGLAGPGIELRWGQDCRQPFRSAIGSPSHLYSVYQVIPGGKAVGSGVKHPRPSNAMLYPARSQWGTYYGCCSRRDV